eukprot:scaffold80116_cov36-Phaeocystis_antarctica.AAC.1
MVHGSGGTSSSSEKSGPSEISSWCGFGLAWPVGADSTIPRTSTAPLRLSLGVGSSPCSCPPLRAGLGSAFVVCGALETTIGCTCSVCSVYAAACRCRAGAVQMPCRCRAGAVQVPCRCRAGAVQVPCRCRADAVQMQCAARRRGDGGVAPWGT